jgi:hypothetical protein
MSDKPEKINKLKPQPYWTCYAANWNSNRNFKLMNLNERGLLWTLYNEYWVNGALPSDKNELAKYFGFEIKYFESALTAKVMSFFQVANTHLRCPELDDYLENIKSRRESQSTGGRKGYENKVKKNLSSSQGIPEGSPQGIPEGSLNQFTSSQFKSSQVNKKVIDCAENQEWLASHEAKDSELNGYLKQSRGF